MNNEEKVVSYYKETLEKKIEWTFRLQSTLLTVASATFAVLVSLSNLSTNNACSRILLLVVICSNAPQWGIGEKSLRKLSAIVLGQRVSKAQRLSNWEAATFTDKQKLYAATDAWVCTAIYDRLLHTPQIKHPEL